jgi:ATP-dependent helicase/nuclease subunit B
MEGFIKKVAAFIHAQDYSLRDLVIILPSERAVRYVSTALVTAYEKPIFSPEITTIDRWIKQFVPPVIDRTRLLLCFYEVYLQTPEGQSETFEDFTTWANMVLSDFDDLDRYLLDHQQVFKNLKAIKELESWQIDDEKLTKSQLKFMQFWERLPLYYQKVNEAVAQKGFTTSAKAYRMLAENIELIHNRKSKHFVFAGFNALSKAELTIMRKLVTAKQADILWDADEFYLKNLAHEAGHFLRRNIDFLGQAKPLFVGATLGKQPMNIKVVACAQQTGQAKVAAKELFQLAQSSPESLNKTLLLLADEGLLSAVVKNIPSEIGKANITLGLPLTQTPVKTWVDILFGIQENKGRFKTVAVYYKDLQQLVNHVFTLNFATKEELSELIHLEKETVQYNRIFQRLDRLKLSERLQRLFELAFIDWNHDWSKGMECIRDLNALLLENLPETAAFERNAIVVFDDALLLFEKIISEGLPLMALRSFKSLFFQHWSRANMAYHGNPTSGLQIMGLLETRLLDFEHLIVLGFNEGSLPATNAIQTVIPMDLRQALELPSTREKQGLFAHHFYRLLHQCKDLTITYTTSMDKIGGNEPSRYLAQLELELSRQNPNIQIKKYHYTLSNSNEQKQQSEQIPKSPQIIERIDRFLERALSASALNKYLTCPMDYYYRYLVDFGEDKEVEEELESSSFGSFIHSVLEDLYQPYVLFDKNNNSLRAEPIPLTLPIIDGMLKRYEKLMHQKYMAHFGNDESLFQRGKNLLSYEMSLEMTKRLLLEERKRIQDNAEKPLCIIQLEGAYDWETTVEWNGQTKHLRFSGYIDRVDRLGDEYRVIDYKTGVVSESDLMFKSPKEDGLKMDAFRGCKFSLQLTLYCLFFRKRFGFFPADAQIISLINPGSPYSLKVEKSETPIPDVTTLFNGFLKEFLTELYQVDVPFAHAEKSMYCAYCVS